MLRSIGYTSRRIKMLYTYEAFVLVISSSLLGIIIGVAVGWTMSVQQSMFMSMPPPFYFPIVQTIIVFIVSLLCAVLSTIGPTSSLTKKEISSILRIA